MPRPWTELTVGRAPRAAGGESIPRLYTRTGDHGETGLSGAARVGKDALRIHAYGTYDELGSWLGLVAASLPDGCREVRATVQRLQHELFIAQAELARKPGSARTEPAILPRHVERLEQEIDAFDAQHPAVRSFVVPGGSAPASALHIARAVARRAERALVALHRQEPLSPALLAWANRLSDLLFALALATNHALGVAETAPQYDV